MLSIRRRFLREKKRKKRKKKKAIYPYRTEEIMSGGKDEAEKR